MIGGRGLSVSRGPECLEEGLTRSAGSLVYDSWKQMSARGDSLYENHCLDEGGIWCVRNITCRGDEDLRMIATSISNTSPSGPGQLHKLFSQLQQSQRPTFRFIEAFEAMLLSEPKSILSNVGTTGPLPSRPKRRRTLSISVFHETTHPLGSRSLISGRCIEGAGYMGRNERMKVNC